MAMEGPRQYAQHKEADLRGRLSEVSKLHAEELNIFTTGCSGNLAMLERLECELLWALSKMNYGWEEAGVAQRWRSTINMEVYREILHV